METLQSQKSKLEKLCRVLQAERKETQDVLERYRQAYPHLEASNDGERDTQEGEQEEAGNKEDQDKELPRAEEASANQSKAEEKEAEAPANPE